MTADRWRRIDSLYRSALERPPEARADFLVQACAGDTDLKTQIEALLADPPARFDVQPGAMVGAYRILDAIGAGGMGAVFRAEDTRLGRHVAIKFLHPRLAGTTSVRQRFEREAQAISALNHPHVCALYDIGSHNGASYLVMEYVHGESLADRLRKGPLPFDAVLRIGSEIADALGAAHAKGTVHRDLKPGNIMLADRGAKVLDFGLARVARTSSEPGGTTATVTEALTAEGALMGTWAYMAPEQVEGKAADHRADIFAFGLVLYEMATGRRAFPHDSQAALIAAVLTAEPNFDALRAATNSEFERIVRACLAKDPNNRWQNAWDIKRVLSWPGSAGGVVASPRVKPAAKWTWAAGGVAAIALGFLAGAWLRPPRESVAAPIRFPVALAGAALDRQPALSPDGSQVAFIANAGSSSELRVRRFDSESDVALPGTEGAGGRPFWSPDGKWIAFHLKGKLSKIRVAGGRPQSIAEAAGVAYGTWSKSGEIVFTPTQREPLFRVPDSGGAPRALTALDASRTENSHRSPSFLPDGDRFLFTARCGKRENNALYLGSLKSGKSSILAGGVQSKAVYAPARQGLPASLVYVRDGALVAHLFDGSRFTGDPMPLVDAIAYRATGAQGSFDLSADGRVLLYATPSALNARLSRFDPAGSRVGDVGLPGDYEQARISPSGARVLYTKADDRTGNRDLWTMDVGSGAITRLTTHPANDWFGIWAPDSARIAFGSDRAGGPDFSVYLKPALDPGAPDRELAMSPRPKSASPSDWSRDGRWLSIDAQSAGTKGDVWVARMIDPPVAFPFVATEFTEAESRFSPDGKWLAYVSDENGGPDIYVRPFNGAPAQPGTQIRISRGGGDFPAWSPKGDAIYFVSPDETVHRAEFRNGETRESSLFKPCQSTAMAGRPGVGAVWQQAIDVGPDGRLMVACLAEVPGKFTVWTNWTPR